MKEYVKLNLETYDFLVGRNNKAAELEKELHEVKRQLDATIEGLEDETIIGRALKHYNDNGDMKAFAGYDALGEKYIRVGAMLESYRAEGKQ